MNKITDVCDTEAIERINNNLKKVVGYLSGATDEDDSPTSRLLHLIAAELLVLCLREENPCERTLGAFLEDMYKYSHKQNRDISVFFKG